MVIAVTKWNSGEEEEERRKERKKTEKEFGEGKEDLVMNLIKYRTKHVKTHMETRRITETAAAVSEVATRGSFQQNPLQTCSVISTS